MRALLGSGGESAQMNAEVYRDLMSENFADCERVVFVPFASNDYDGYTKGCKNLPGNLDTNWSAYEFEDPLAAIEAMDGIYVGGGNTWLLVRALHERGLIEPIREAVLQKRCSLRWS